jgi:hypothetical protein
VKTMPAPAVLLQPCLVHPACTRVGMCDKAHATVAVLTAPLLLGPSGRVQASPVCAGFPA